MGADFGPAKAAQRSLAESMARSLWPASIHVALIVVDGVVDDGMVAIDTLTNKVLATVPIGQAPQAVAYVPDAVPHGAGTDNLQPLGVAGQALHLALASVRDGVTAAGPRPTSVTLFDQGLLQVLEASVTGLQPKQPYVLALSGDASGARPVQALAGFMINPAGSAVVNAVGPIHQLVVGGATQTRRYLVIVPGSLGNPGRPVQVQVPS